MSGFAHDGNDIELVYSKNVDFSGGATPTGQILTNGQMLIGTTAVNAGGTHINVGTLTSPDSSITFGFSSPNITAVANAGALNVVTSNATPQFANVAGSRVLNFSLSNLVLGSSLPNRTTGLLNTGLGQLVLNATTTANANTAVGNGAGNALTTGGINVAFGYAALQVATVSVSNTAIGASSLAQLTTAIGRNTALGNASLGALKTGSDNIGIGWEVGSQYTAAEASNIIIGNIGVTGESNVMRLGTQGSGTGQQLQTYIAGVINTVSGRVVKTTVPGAYPYTTLTTDYVILVDTSAARTINLIATPVTGTTYRIKDNVGTAAAFNITITPNAGTIDGAASYVISSNWGSVDCLYTGSSWRVL